MIEEHLNNIRKKPKAVRSQYAMVAASVFTGVLALLWATTLPERFAVENVDPFVQQQLAAAAAVEEERPDGVKALFSSLRDGMAALMFNTESEEDVVAETPDTKTIDIDALLRESAPVEEPPAPSPETATSTEATSTPSLPPAESSASSTPPAPTTPVGEVILIGTTSSQKNVPENQ